MNVCLAGGMAAMSEEFGINLMVCINVWHSILMIHVISLLISISNVENINWSLKVLAVYPKSGPF